MCKLSGQYLDASVNCVRSATIRSPTPVVALILSRMDYENDLLIGLPSANTPPHPASQSVLNAAVRFICNLRCCDHIAFVLVGLQWLRLL